MEQRSRPAGSAVRSGPRSAHRSPARGRPESPVSDAHAVHPGGGEVPLLLLGAGVFGSAELVEVLSWLERFRVQASELVPGDQVVLRHPGTGVFAGASVSVSRVADPHAVTPRWWLVHLRFGVDDEVAFTCAPQNTTCFRVSGPPADPADAVGWGSAPGG
jgi:hypothetical protein